MTQPRDEKLKANNEQGQEIQEQPCIYLDEKGKHPWTVWHYTHKPGYKFWVPICPGCGYVDTDGILKELAEKGYSRTPDLVPLDKHEVEGIIASIALGDLPHSKEVKIAEAICQKFGTAKKEPPHEQ